ncbi:MAG: glycosyltransferase, partial [Dehalococcoidia bacterium]|nr:glycosyltransferase [Dehalococcoidia bacterium]
VVHYYQPGLSYEENHLAFAQAALGAEVTLVTSTGLVPEWEQGARAFPRGWGVERGVNVVRLRPRAQAWGRRQLLLRGLGDALSRAAPDVLHVHSATGLLTLQALSWARRRRVPVVIDSHLCYFNILPRGAVK